MTEPRRATEKPSNWNVPNILTVIRIFLVPVYVVLLFAAPEDFSWRLAATVVFVVAMLTDLADGYIARSRNLVTDFGKLWDPIADKALTGAAFVSLTVLDFMGIDGGLPWYFTVIILVREWGITWVRAVIAKYGIMAANKGGKAKTLTQTLALILFSLGLQFLPAWLATVAWVLMWAALILTVVTGFDYLWSAWKIRREGKARQVG